MIPATSRHSSDDLATGFQPASRTRLATASASFIMSLTDETKSRHAFNVRAVAVSPLFVMSGSAAST